MAGDNDKEIEVPAWQRGQDQVGWSDSRHKQTPSLSVSDEDILNIARDFLKEESIQKIPREEKITYLKEKGLNDEAIGKLLNEQDRDQNADLKTIHDTTDASSSKSTPPVTSNDPPSPEPSSSPRLEPAQPASTATSNFATTTPRDIPPIITYPEFLLKPTKPPPLVTISRLTTAAYAIGAVSALTYGASKYIVEPLLQTLTEARHDLAATTLTSLEQLNTKLESNVSHIPYIPSKPGKRHPDDEDVESITSDPTELFHRDVATQTSPSLSRRSSTSHTSSTKPAQDATTIQTQSLSRLLTTLSSLSTSQTHSATSTTRLLDSISSLQSKLDGIENEARGNTYGTLNGVYDSKKDSKATGSAKGGSGLNEAQKFKQEIRALKGAFLSSRNFASVPRPTAAGAAGSYSGYTGR